LDFIGWCLTSGHPFRKHELAGKIGHVGYIRKCPNETGSNSVIKVHIIDRFVLQPPVNILLDLAAVARRMRRSIAFAAAKRRIRRATKLNPATRFCALLPQRGNGATTARRREMPAQKSRR
jgi:hypothetical protein